MAKSKVAEVIIWPALDFPIPGVIFRNRRGAIKIANFPERPGCLLSGPFGLALQLFKLIAAALRRTADHSAYTQCKLYANG